MTQRGEELVCNGYGYRGYAFEADTTFGRKSLPPVAPGYELGHAFGYDFFKHFPCSLSSLSLYVSMKGVSFS